MRGAVGFLVLMVGCAEPSGDAPPVEAIPVTAIAGRSRAEAPGFGYDDTFAFGESLEAAIPVAEGTVSARGYVVAHRSAEEWESDPTLSDVTGEVEDLELSHLEGQVLWPSVEPDAGVLGSTYDVVLDVDGDARFSEADHLDQGPDGLGIRVAADFAEAGPHPVSQAEVSGGDWLAERVYWPDDLADLGPRPLVVISHGNGHDYTWYDYLGEHLASWGYVVMAHENETEPGIETASTTTLTNTDWLLGHLGDVGDGALTGLVDASRIGWIGHSRGGEGVVRAYARLQAGDYVPDGFGAENIGVIVSIAPTVFNSVDVSDPGGVRYHLLAGSSDGDVTGSPEFPETQSFRLYQAATGTRSSTYIYGASHEDFDCCGADDGEGPDQLERDDVQTIVKAYLLAVIAEGLDDDATARALLTRDPMRVPATAFTTTVLSTWRPADGLVIDDFQGDRDLRRSSSGAGVTGGVHEVFEGRLDDADTDLAYQADDPMNGMTQAEDDADDAQGIVFGWETPADYAYDLPAALGDWSGGRYLMLNACQVTRDPITVDLDGPLDFSVTLVDGAGVTVTRSARPYGSVAPPYQRNRAGSGKGWANAFSTVRVPLADFTTGGTGLDLSDVRTLRLEFGGEGDAPTGRLGLDDVEVVR